jgi:hypothetical protein
MSNNCVASSSAPAAVGKQFAGCGSTFFPMLCDRPSPDISQLLLLLSLTPGFSPV